MLLNSGDAIAQPVKGKRERIGRILQMHSNKTAKTSRKFAGDIVAAAGLKDVRRPAIPRAIRQADHHAGADGVPGAGDLGRGRAEDQGRPGKMGSALCRNWPRRIRRSGAFRPGSGQTMIKGMGELHLDIIVDRMKREFKVEANVGAPQVAYRETIGREAGDRFVRTSQTGGVRVSTARVNLEFEPVKRARLSSSRTLSCGGSVPKEYMPGVDKGLRGAAGVGVIAGFPVIDFKVDPGRWRLATTSIPACMAFEIAGLDGLREGAQGRAGAARADHEVEVVTPEDYMGDVIGDFNQPPRLPSGYG